jgi:hypothetical protein
MSVRFRSLVNRVMDDNEYNAKTARDVIVELSAKDAALREELLYLGADQLIRSYYTGQRRIAEETAEPQKYEYRDVPETPEKQAKRVRNAERRLLWDRYALFGHKPLRVAEKADLKESERARRAQAAGNIRCADFEAAVNEGLPKGKKVGDFFAISKIVELAKAHNVIPSSRA